MATSEDFDLAIDTGTAIDLAAVEEWVDGQSDINDLLQDGLPVGPDEGPTSAVDIDRIGTLLRRIAEEIGLAI
ncbi:hypothetical protein BHQ21_25960 [Mycobacterium sherrisii]|uniref:Uncharacterized protein n=1 Tax=Mycobacterium sherrisii TaxID=243061 RepID=A0A1E3S805_9MYCO|nr:hypothetical protein [Mycobacterium sherrisii]ODQ98279.1 hypothetical protein BHQ21_25960 [Mycobacterium sherrisii]